MLGRVRGSIWENDKDLNWYYVEEMDGSFFGTEVTCMDAAYILCGKLNPPKLEQELDPADFAQVSEETVASTCAVCA